MRALPAALALAAALLPAPAEAAPVVSSACTRAIAAEERARGVPQGLLMAMGFSEAGRGVEGGATVWPWTVNVEGEGRWFATREEAIAYVGAELAAGRRSIDVGCMQVNLRWHPDAFRDLREAFEPEANVAYAGRFLEELRARDAAPGLAGWLRAAGNYHSMEAGLAEAYRGRVVQRWQKVARPEILQALAEGPAAPVPRPGDGQAVDDPFGRALVAHWATPFGTGGGESGPVLDLAERPPFAATPPPGEEAPAAEPRRKAARNMPVRRFSPLPEPPVKETPRPDRRPGLLMRQTPS